MTTHNYAILAASIFALIAVLQAARAISGLPVTIGNNSIPIWASWLACVVGIILSALGWMAGQT